MQSNGTVHAALLCVLCLTGPVLHRACCRLNGTSDHCHEMLAGVSNFRW